MEKILGFINNNTGVTLLLSAIIYAIHERIKTKNAKKLQSHLSKSENITSKTYEAENKLYKLMSTFFLSNNDSEEFCINQYDEVRKFIVDNDLFLREPISNIGTLYADYIIEEVSVGLRDIEKQAKMLKQFKNHFRK